MMLLAVAFYAAIRFHIDTCTVGSQQASFCNLEFESDLCPFQFVFVTPAKGANEVLK